MSRPEPIPVAVLRFESPMDACGLSVASSCSSRTAKKESRHEVVFLPWLDHFEVRFFTPGEDAPRVSMVPVARVKSWDPVSPVARPSAVENAPELKQQNHRRG